MTPVLGEFGMAVGFVLIVALAMIVAVVGVFGLLFKAFGAIFRALFGGVSGSAPGSGRSCRNPACGHENPANAVFCGRCGRRL